MKRLPALTAFYGLRPWEIEDLTFAELEQYLRQLDSYERELAKLQKG